jgi:hypothetical protein
VHPEDHYSTDMSDDARDHVDAWVHAHYPTLSEAEARDAVDGLIALADLLLHIASRRRGKRAEPDQTIAID